VALFGVGGLVQVVEWLAQSPIVAGVLLGHATLVLLLIAVFVVLVEAATVKVAFHLEGWVIKLLLVARLLSLFQCLVSIFFGKVRTW